MGTKKSVDNASVTSRSCVEVYRSVLLFLINRHCKGRSKRRVEYCLADKSE